MVGLDVDSEDSSTPAELEVFSGAVDNESDAGPGADDAAAIGSGRSGIGRLGVFTLRPSTGLFIVGAPSEAVELGFVT